MGFVVDAVGDAAGKVGNMFGFGGGANQYRAPGDYSAQIGAAGQLALGDYNQQQQLVQALQAQAAGTGGPSLAQGMLQRGMDASNANVAGQLASIRGMNPALAARSAVDAQARGTQDLAGQSALLRQREQLAAQGQLGQMLATQRGQNIGLLGTYGGMQQGINQVNAGVAGQNANIASNAWGGLMGGVGSAIPFMAGGGPVPSGIALQDPLSYLGMQSQLNPWAFTPQASPQKGAQPYGADSFLTNDMMGGAAYTANGGEIPGRAPVAGDSVKNDKVPAMLSPGEVVIPRSIAQAEDAPEKAAAFVRAIRRQKGPEGGYGRVLERVRDLKGRIDEIEKMCKGGMVGYADGGEVKADAKPQPNFLQRMLTRSGPSNSSPSVFDAKSAVVEHNKRLQQAADSK